MLGQVTHGQDQQLARLAFLAPGTALEGHTRVNLREYMIQQIGKRGAFHLLAEVEEGTTAFDNLRQAGFALYVHQRIWKSPEQIQLNPNPPGWRDITGRDVIAVRSLYNTLVPPLVQQVESLPNEHMKGQVYYLEDELKAYAEIRYGQRGIWVHPFIHPDTNDVARQLEDLLLNLPNRHSRPVYLCIRSYQSWLGNYLEDIQAAAGPKQAVMVKHLAIAKKVKNSFNLSALEGGQQEVPTSLMRSERNNN